MKMAYEKPIMDVEVFVANEYVAACGDSGKTYLFNCDAPGGNLYYFPNSDGNLDGIYTGTDGAKKLGSYHPCSAMHEASVSDGFYEGFIDYNKNGEYDPYGSETLLGTTPAEAVIVWRGHLGFQGHATKNLNINSWETAKS